MQGVPGISRFTLIRFCFHLVQERNQYSTSGTLTSLEFYGRLCVNQYSIYWAVALWAVVKELLYGGGRPGGAII